MPKLSEANDINSIRFEEQSSAPSTPASGYGQLYAINDGSLRWKDDAGTETNLVSGGGGDFGTGTLIAISAGVLASSGNRNIIVQAETGTSDDLIEITGLSVGKSVLLRADTGDEITVKHNDAGATVKIYLNGNEDAILDEENPLILYYVDTNVLSQMRIPTAIKARITQSSGTSLNTSTQTFINFNTEDYDTAGFHDNVSNNTRLTVPENGTYRITANFGLAASSSGIRDVRIYKNGTTDLANIALDPPSSGAFRINLTAIASLVSGDYVELRGFQSSGGSLTTETATTWMAIVKE